MIDLIALQELERQGAMQPRPFSLGEALQSIRDRGPVENLASQGYDALSGLGQFAVNEALPDVAGAVRDVYQGLRNPPAVRVPAQWEMDAMAPEMAKDFSAQAIANPATQERMQNIAMGFSLPAGIAGPKRAAALAAASARAAELRAASVGARAEPEFHGVLEDVVDHTADLLRKGQADAVSASTLLGDVLDKTQSRITVNQMLGRLYESTTGRLPMADFGASAVHPRVAAEAAKQVPTLNRNRWWKQSVVTIDDARNWLAARGLLPGGLGWKPTPAIEQLVEHPDYQNENIFDRIRLAAQLERRPEAFVYDPIINPRNVNSKGAGGVVLQGDTIRGCDNNCYECYACKLGAKTQMYHEVPVRGVFKPGAYLAEKDLLRIGTMGDPAKDWDWSNKQIDDLISRSRAKGRKVSPEEHVYGISKLQDVENFNAKVFPNIEASLDPMYPAHMRETMINLLRIKTENPELNVIVRIRSVASKNKDLMASQQAAIDFANTLDLPVLETRMRFKKNVAFDILELDRSMYHKKDGQHKLKEPFLKGKVKNWYLCDQAGTGKCIDCGMCKHLMIKTRDKNIKQVNDALEQLGIAPGSIKRQPKALDVRGNVPMDERLVQIDPRRVSVEELIGGRGQRQAAGNQMLIEAGLPPRKFK